MKKNQNLELKLVNSESKKSKIARIYLKPKTSTLKTNNRPTKTHSAKNQINILKS